MQRTSPLADPLPSLLNLLHSLTHSHSLFRLCFLSGENSAVALAWTQILNGAGGGISLACVNVMVQASVPHEDLGIVISNLSLWTQLFGAIGSAVGQ